MFSFLSRVVQFIAIGIETGTSGNTEFSWGRPDVLEMDGDKLTHSHVPHTPENGSSGELGGGAFYHNLNKILI